ncbi:glycosyl hydrolase family 28-related protein [Microlunatus sp. GCM10028923]|uniref:glycosyl hydrolase family 28-related protein n=1 Tax=Microlunatus sp. GCM10028923 TaxID=3273400 RepID=UPI00360B0721
MSDSISRKHFLGLGAVGAALGTAAIVAAAGPAHAETAGDWQNVKDFGATGDGQTNDAPAIQQAIDQAGKLSAIFFPPGTYRCDRTITSSARSISIIGAGIGVSRVIFTAAGHGFDLALNSDEATRDFDYLNVRDLSVLTRSPDGQSAIRGVWSNPTGQYPHCNIRNVEFDHDLSGTVGNWATGIDLQDAWKTIIDTINYRSNGQGVGIELRGRCVDSLITNPHLSNVGVGIRIGALNEGIVIYNAVVVGGKIGVQTLVGDNGRKGPWTTVRDSHFNTAVTGVELRGTSDSWVCDSLIYKLAGSSEDWVGVRVIDCNNSRITGNQLFDTSGLADREVPIEVRDSNLITLLHNQANSCKNGFELHNSVACTVSHNVGRNTGASSGGVVHLAATTRGCVAHSNLSQVDSGTAPPPVQNLGSNNHVADNHSYVGGLA